MSLSLRFQLSSSSSFNNIPESRTPTSSVKLFDTFSFRYQEHIPTSSAIFPRLIMSIPQTLKPGDFRGFGRGEGNLGGFVNDEFASHCPPDVQPNTRIIAVCGASDTTGYGSPDKDGWIFSDFFLYHHLLQDSRKFPVRFVKMKLTSFPSSKVPFRKPSLADLCQSTKPRCKL
jgi:hypothetical protein